MALSRARIDEIEAITQTLITECYQSHGAAVNPPINVPQICKDYGLAAKIMQFEDNEIEGALKPDLKMIVVNSKSPLTRQLFTMSHELGHYILHDDENEDIFYRKDLNARRLNDLPEDKRIVEQEANWFAASLLMPKKLLTEWFNLSGGDRGLLARVFSVSDQAMYYR